jgi:hypothetical protein
MKYCTSRDCSFPIVLFLSELFTVVFVSLTDDLQTYKLPTTFCVLEVGYILHERSHYLQCLRKIHKSHSSVQNYWGSGLCPSSGILILENAMCQKLDMFPSSCDGRDTPTPFGPLGSANLNHWTTLSKGSNRVGVSLPSA